MDNRDIEAFYEEFSTPTHIREHCKKVTEIANKIGQKMNENGVAVDLGKLRAAGLLHDALRIVDFKNWPPKELYKDASVEDITTWEDLHEKYEGMHHADAMGQVLRERGYPDLAQIIEEHKFVQILDEAGFSSLESKILYYSDKLVLHDKIVTLKERLEDGYKRHGKDQNPEAEQKLLLLEEEILSKTK